MEQTGEHGAARGVFRQVLRGVFLVFPIVALLLPFSYARVSPDLSGFPFFYWYQFLLIPGCSLAIWAAYLL